MSEIRCRQVGHLLIRENLTCRLARHNSVEPPLAPLCTITIPDDRRIAPACGAFIRCPLSAATPWTPIRMTDDVLQSCQAPPRATASMKLGQVISQPGRTQRAA